ncbi:MAG: hypothetical protein GY803_07015 [Chloroflexi bacterium]|nr:hypothetical protein [Chloroflexota bacterium]
MTFGTPRPFGLREIKITTIDGATQVALPAAQKMAFKEMLMNGEMRGGDILQEMVSIRDGLEFTLENGGIPLDAWAIMTGTAVVAAGTTPNQTNTFTAVAGQCYPYFKIYGKAIGPGCVGDVHVKIFKAKLSEPLEGEFGDGEFFVTKCAGKGLTDGVNGIYEIVENETAAVLPSS